MRTPEELYRAFQKGDREAFAEIVATYRESVTHFLYRYVSNLDDAEDLAEDTFVAVLEHPHRFRFSCSLRSYLFAIARNKALHHLRKHRNVVPLEYEEQLASPTVSPEERLIFKEQLEQVLGLPEKYRMALLLTAVDGLSYAEAATVLGVNEKQIKNLCYRARQRLLAEGGVTV